MAKKLLSTSLLSIVLLCLSCKKEDKVNQELRAAAVHMNTLTPQTLSGGVRLDSVSTSENRTLQYNYTLTDDIKEELTPEKIHEYTSSAKGEALKSLKNSPDMKNFRKNNVTLKYYYYDKNRNPIIEFSVSPSDYGK